MTVVALRSIRRCPGPFYEGAHHSTKKREGPVASSSSVEKKLQQENDHYEDDQHPDYQLQGTESSEASPTAPESAESSAHFSRLLSERAHPSTHCTR